MPTTKKHLFTESPYYDKEKLTIALFGTKYQDADIDYYHEKAELWSESKKEKKVDWLATIKNWMLTNMREGKFIDKNFKPMPAKLEEMTTGLTKNLTDWQKDEETPPKQAPQPQQATQLELPTDWSQYWENCQEKARNGIHMIIALPLYQWLLDTNQMTLTNDEKKVIFGKAKERYILELTAAYTPQEKTILRKMKQGNWDSDPVLLETVRTRAKILAVREHLYRSIQPIKA